MNSSGKGGSGNAASTNMYNMMPGWAQDKYGGVMQGMPGTVDIGFGGATYPGMYGPFARAAKTAFTPGGSTGTQAPSALAGGLAAAAPWMWMAANNQGAYNFNTPQSAMGAWSSQNPYGSAAPYSTGYPYASGYMPGWNYQNTGF